jgi:hypothetical protein
LWCRPTLGCRTNSTFIADTVKERGEGQKAISRSANHTALDQLGKAGFRSAALLRAVVER